MVLLLGRPHAVPEAGHARHGRGVHEGRTEGHEVEHRLRDQSSMHPTVERPLCTHHAQLQVDNAAHAIADARPVVVDPSRVADEQPRHAAAHPAVLACLAKSTADGVHIAHLFPAVHHEEHVHWTILGSRCAKFRDRSTARAAACAVAVAVLHLDAHHEVPGFVFGLCESSPSSEQLPDREDLRQKRALVVRDTSPVQEAVSRRKLPRI
mmetsp:Transcript_163398/g.523925  ORF Transcript_163398/g.523925 Transcript_163398/m.523925 type:complete len:209 (+) Transcript_163398:735-1361(+)